MSILGNEFEGQSTGRQPSQTVVFIEEMRRCTTCGEVVDAYEVETGMCEDCYSDADADDNRGTKYCCGQIYELGESSCASCGDSL